ncbi:neck protein [Vibrio phage 1.216.O._10N.222.55.C12]|nr:neck protein [Vibrio phage 1.216.O._10N.222.55.C12]
MSWSKKLNSIIIDNKELTERQLRAAVLDGVNTAILGSPVGNPDLWVWNHPELGYVDYVAWKGKPENYVGGQFRTNWRVTYGMPNYAIKDSENWRSNKEEVKQGVLAMDIGSTLVFSNPMPYGPRLEYDAWSTQAPDGIVRPAVKRMVKILNKDLGKK